MDPIAHLPAVGLDELNTTSQLLIRTDRKYVVPLTELPAVITGVDGLRVLELAGSRRARYESTYFDTTTLASWAASAHPRRRRWKVRTRLYADTGECWLEVKTRGARGATVKERIPHDAADRDDLTGQAAGWVGDRLAAAGAPDVDARELVATLHTSYRRTTLLLPNGAGRATIDADLSWTSSNGRAHVGEVLVIETKSAGRAAGALDRRLWQLGHRPARISKYGTGLCLLTPELPRNRWHRVTARQLDPTLCILVGSAL
ncbi:polyphosphate polymerase domain-containing protein [Nocardioides sp. IC4_145]|uniref:polyphosphate polymerase domain-containing protein n=1 Tax=Nocardioides sp. IC4_145 TaxID=2714037 RepID=UPI00140BAF1D|nr:polyphosphate polymerase domain-containing protein [Nocardioides sp. IC4_145]NHC21929.1 polyphosphate polymerase domain-containing protein [Nocardioides sp. IC4_145]